MVARSGPLRCGGRGAQTHLAGVQPTVSQSAFSHIVDRAEAWLGWRIVMHLGRRDAVRGR